ncbi:MAG: hypothetical protein AUK47_10175 [Deltaproteobacteria bacterium CG2_30_63_29]|nr:MAG: hypothetical protein AUK47_10175 [Deltaproteobacteria bacterium CG2_30_63_29]PJB34476.1 MAG: hypothetical protein CO108_28185 [Deltaproteobacteria bacterium CG_4_9_14_3_um_filter_63_12]
MVTRRLRARQDEENEGMDKEYRFDLSVGVVEAQPPHSGELDHLINPADQAMYLMKSNSAASE